MTVLDCIQKSADFLGRKGIDSARLHAELLLAHVLKLPRMKLYLNFERTLTDPELESMRELVRRRGQREPLQHITGSTSFCGLEMAVNSHVLVPRPETELLAEQGWTFLLSRTGSPRAIDFGSGSGCIAIALAAKCPGCRITALDVSEAALAVARSNAERHGLGDRIEFVRSEGFSALASEARPADLLISNPPYIASAEIATLDPEVRDHDPRGALDGGPDGLAFYRLLAAESRPLLQSDGRIMVELGDEQAEPVRGIFQAQNWIVEAILDDYTQRPRILIARN